MARPRTVSDDAILQAARAVFLEFGPSASTTVIAERAGLSQAGLFKRFGTKADLMVSALSPPAIPPFALLLAAGPDPDQPIRPQLQAIARSVALFFRELVPCVMVLSASGISPADLMTRFDVPPPLMATRAITAWLGQAMAQGRVRSADPEPIAFGFLGALHMRSFLNHLSSQPLSDADLADFADSVVHNLWLGLAPQEAP